MHVEIDDRTSAWTFPLDGVRLDPSHHVELGATSPMDAVIRISPGPGITDYVTHEADFQYGTYGIHIGQDDRLTFLGGTQTLAVHLIDCRAGSSTLHERLTISLDPSPTRVLTIPRGVAHTIDGLPGVVTRDEPVWYADQGNRHWNPDNDLVSFSRSSTRIPVVEVNRWRLPVAGHLLVSRMSQAANRANHAAYLARYSVNIAGRQEYVHLEPDWAERNQPPALPEGGPRAETSYLMTGPASFTIAPSLDSCTSDILEISGAWPAEQCVTHPASRRILTWLGGDTSSSVVLADHRGGREEEHPLDDPRFAVTIDPGRWYRIRTSSRSYYRVEMERVIDPGNDALPPPGMDMVVAPVGQLPDQGSAAPGAYIPGAAANALARMEAAAHHRTRQKGEVNVSH